MLDAALGLACVYLLLAIFCSTVNDWIAALLAVRSKMLRDATALLLGDEVERFYRHPLMQALMQGGVHPEHVASSAFAKIVMDLATPKQPGSLGIEDLKRGITEDLPPGALRTSLLAVTQGTGKHVIEAQQAIEAWFDHTMDEVSRRYKRRAQLWTAVMAAAVTVAVNADTIRLSSALLAGNPAADGLGWHQTAASGWPQRLAGWMLTSVAVSLGAPFWFDAARNLLAATRPRPTYRGN